MPCGDHHQLQATPDSVEIMTHQATREGRHDHGQDIPEQAQQPIIQPPEDAYHGGQTNALSRTVEVSARLLELEATSNANSRQASQRAVGSGGRAWVESGQQRVGGSGKMRSNNKVTQGTLALDLCFGCIWGISERREWTAKVLRG
jgi:hypothetical protein